MSACKDSGNFARGAVSVSKDLGSVSDLMPWGSLEMKSSVMRAEYDSRVVKQKSTEQNGSVECTKASIVSGACPHM